MKSIVFITFLFIHLTAFGQNSNASYLLSFTDSISGKERYGFKSPNGKVIIKPKYEVIGTDTMYKIAFVTFNYKWIAINRKDSIVLSPYIFDNGPDYIQEGLFRFIENKKIGFANMEGQKVIKAAFDFASTFSSGLAAYNIGGQKKMIDDEHSTWSGGLWGFIDKNGKVVIEPKFINVYDFKGKYCEAWTQDNQHILIDKKGNKVKKFMK